MDVLIVYEILFTLTGKLVTQNYRDFKYEIKKIIAFAFCR
jgi:hypothetical protein